MTTENGEREQADDDGPVKSWTPKATLIVLGLLTLAYLVGLFLLISRIAPCEDLRISSYWFLRPVDRYVQCRDINELGDALAGAFAPLAFLWLAGAVFIQSRELAAQRKELQLARDEARQTREVMREQAAESRASTAFIGEQTEILKKEQRQRERELADAEFNQLIRGFMMARSGKPLLPVKGKRKPQGSVMAISQYQLGWDEGQNVKSVEDVGTFFHQLLHNTGKAQDDISSVEKGLVTIDGWKPFSFASMIGTLETMLKMQDALSSPHKIYADTLLLSDLKLSLELVAAALEKFPRLQTPG